ncbi:MAG: hypothetical protein VW405_22180 [Rhodospirillaceae bacterium]
MELGGIDYFRFVLALAFVLGLIAILAAVARRAGFGFPAAALKSGGKRRLAVVEATQVDGRRRLVLVRRDDVEHLILLSPTAETVVETGIPTPAGFAKELRAVERRDTDGGDGGPETGA